jgi:hypothetical protein
LSILITVVAGFVCGCANRQAVVAVTGTNIGLEISQNPATQTPQAKLGYNRGEVAIVPTNRSANEKPEVAGGGARDVADVLMELKFANIFSFNTSGIYQRLAVGSTAVSQPGAAFMFAKDERGAINAETANAIKTIEAIKSRDPIIRGEMKTIADIFRDNPDKRAVIENIVKESGYEDWDAFIDRKPNEPSAETITEIKKKLANAGIKL